MVSAVVGGNFASLKGRTTGENGWGSSDGGSMNRPLCKPSTLRPGVV
ncbi:MAG: hypothetical protein ACTS5A_03805 [Candidatus Hodgkinia cicadicola]